MIDDLLQSIFYVRFFLYFLLRYYPQFFLGKYSPRPRSGEYNKVEFVHTNFKTQTKLLLLVSQENLWLMEDFCMFCPILEVSMLDRRVSGKLCGIAITVGELPTDEQGDEGKYHIFLYKVCFFEVCTWYRFRNTAMSFCSTYRRK